MNDTSPSSVKPNFPLKYLEISGNPYDRGFEYGEKCKKAISRFVDFLYAEFQKNESTKTEVIRTTKKYIPYIENYSSEIMDELKGIAEGSERSLEELVMISLHEERMIFKREGCTALAATGRATVDGETYVGQNWDEGTEMYWEGDMPFLLKIRRNTGPDILAYAYPGMQSNAGMNSKGICISWNTVPRLELKVGVPTYIIITDLLRQRTIGDAIDSILRAERAGCFNFLIGDDTEIYDIEATPRDVDILYSDLYIGHANHYISRKFATLQDMSKIKAHTITRHNRINRLLKEKCGSIDLETCMDILRDHVNYPYSICSHPVTEIKKESLTWASWVQIPKKREWWIAHGPPCQNKAKKYSI